MSGPWAPTAAALSAAALSAAGLSILGASFAALPAWALGVSDFGASDFGASALSAIAFIGSDFFVLRSPAAGLSVAGLVAGIISPAGLLVVDVACCASIGAIVAAGSIADASAAFDLASVAEVSAGTVGGLGMIGFADGVTPCAAGATATDAAAGMLAFVGGNGACFVVGLVPCFASGFAGSADGARLTPACAAGFVADGITGVGTSGTDDPGAGACGCDGGTIDVDASGAGVAVVAAATVSVARDG